ncbi:hypothetical protein BGZ65_006063 [Modicella reniformis]|uniref:Uncharacterized protein n=1 Tax=Modicella reniformis TaxID=1440133 RepID=A0A9P6LS85_9FUNG|nr:hypothetical protein BGZ65_006063 [Modicella reniformis]
MHRQISTGKVMADCDLKVLDLHYIPARKTRTLRDDLLDTSGQSSRRLTPFGWVQSQLLRSMKQAITSSSQLLHDEEPEAVRKQLKVHEKRIKGLETLLKTFYLDMSLVDTTEDGPDSISTAATV